jgi:hypothetical protein
MTSPEGGVSPGNLFVRNRSIKREHAGIAYKPSEVSASFPFRVDDLSTNSDHTHTLTHPRRFLTEHPRHYS